MRPPRALGVAAASLLAVSLVLRRTVRSQGGPEDDELVLVAVFDGATLKSRAAAFRRGTLVAWFGGISLDLRDAGIEPGARLTVRTLCGGIDVKTPPGWRVEDKTKMLIGGLETSTPAADDPDAPVLVLDGLAVLSGIAVGSKKADAADDSSA